MSTRGKHAATETEIDPASPAPSPTSPAEVNIEAPALANARRELVKLNQRYLSAVDKGGRQKAAAKEAFDKVTASVDSEIDSARQAMRQQQDAVRALEVAEESKKAA